MEDMKEGTNNENKEVELTYSYGFMWKQANPFLLIGNECNTCIIRV